MFKTLYLISRHISPFFQFHHHHLRQSVAGLSLDYTVLSGLGALLHLIRTLIYLTSKRIQALWQARYPTINHDNNVEQYWVEFMLDLDNAMVWIVAIAAVQVWGKFRRSWNEEMEVSPPLRILIVLCGLIGLFLALSVKFGGGWLLMSGLSWLDVVDWIGLVGGWFAWLRYWPQFSLNWLCQSTDGLPATVIWLDGLGTLAGLVHHWISASELAKVTNVSVWVLCTRPTGEFAQIVGNLIVFVVLWLQRYRWYKGQRSLVRKKFKLKDVELEDLESN